MIKIALYDGFWLTSWKGLSVSRDWGDDNDNDMVASKATYIVANHLRHITRLVNDTGSRLPFARQLQSRPSRVCMVQLGTGAEWAEIGLTQIS